MCAHTLYRACNVYARTPCSQLMQCARTQCMEWSTHTNNVQGMRCSPTHCAGLAMCAHALCRACNVCSHTVQGMQCMSGHGVCTLALCKACEVCAQTVHGICAGPAMCEQMTLYKACNVRAHTVHDMQFVRTPQMNKQLFSRHAMCMQKLRRLCDVRALTVQGMVCMRTQCAVHAMCGQKLISE